LAREKGVDTLLRAWKNLDGKIPLTIVGDGPLSLEVAEASQSIPGVTWLGQLPRKETLRIISQASLLVNPSNCYETFGLTTIEAFAARTPVIVAGHGALAEVVLDGINGFHFKPGDSDDLSSKVAWLHKNSGAAESAAQTAYRDYKANYTPEANYRRLMACYKQAGCNIGH
jgi:glycosyltransferase involved in cell wall biosynthesis